MRVGHSRVGSDQNSRNGSECLRKQESRESLRRNLEKERRVDGIERMSVLKTPLFRSSCDGDSWMSVDERGGNAKRE